MEKKKLLLHSCCGPCSSAVIERLLRQGSYSITVFYFNPNITDAAEYEKRKAEQKRFLTEFCGNTGAEIGFMEGDYDPQLFLEACRGLEGEPEGGRRCSVCFESRLRRTAALCAELGFDLWDTTLTVSPYKNFEVISEIGSRLARETGTDYLCGNYKKKDGYKRSVELSREYGLYRQHYCGCVFSERSGIKD